MLHGWPGLTTRGLVALADGIIERKGQPDRFDYTYGGYPESTRSSTTRTTTGCVLGGVGGAAEAARGSRRSRLVVPASETSDMPEGMPHLEVRLIDSVGDENPHLDFVLLDTVRAVEQLRAEGRTVLLHCVAGLQPHAHHLRALRRP